MLRKRLKLLNIHVCRIGWAIGFRRDWSNVQKYVQFVGCSQLTGAKPRGTASSIYEVNGVILQQSYANKVQNAVLDLSLHYKPNLILP